MIELKGTITADDYVEALKLSQRPARRTVRFAMVVGILLLYAAWLAVNDALTGKGAWFPVMVFCVVILYWPFWYYIYIPILAQRWHGQQRALHGELQVFVDDSGVQSVSPRCNSSATWEYFRQWAEGERVFVVFQSDVLMNIWPKRALIAPANETDLRELLQSKLSRR
jgi:hypothetical protein